MIKKDLEAVAEGAGSRAVVEWGSPYAADQTDIAKHR
jgi:hypothetical protein